MAAPEQSAPPNRWATSSVVVGVIGLALAAVPVPFTSLAAWPFVVYALAVGAAVWRRGDRRSAARARWGAGLGCAGALIEFAQFLVLIGLGAAGLWALFHAGQN